MRVNIRDNPGIILAAAWVIGIAVYLSAVLPRLDEPIIGWESFMWQEAKTISEGGFSAVGNYSLPPLHTGLLGASLRAFGARESGARMLGVLCFIITPLLLYKVIRYIIAREYWFWAGLWSGVIFMSSPSFIQGSLNIDRGDANLLIVAYLVFFWVIFQSESWPAAQRILFLGFFFSLCLWAKFTTSLVFIAAIPLALILAGAGVKKSIFLGVEVTVAGCVFFALGWLIFCLLFLRASRFMEILQYYPAATAATFASEHFDIKTKMIRDAAQVTLWFSPYLIILIGYVMVSIFRHRRRDVFFARRALLLVCALLILGVYAYANAAFSGFPKYILPAMALMIPLVSVVLCEQSSEMTRRRQVALAALGIAAAAMYSRFFIGDVLCSVFNLRLAQLSNNRVSAYQNIIYQFLLYALLAGLVWLVTALFSKRPAMRRLLIVCVICLVAHNLSLAVIQRQAAYSTRYAYGTYGAGQLKAFFATRPPGTVLTSIEGYVAGVDHLRFGSLRVFEWNDPQFVCRTLAAMRPDYFVYGLGTHMVSQLAKTFRDSSLRAYLKRNYTHRRIGSYEVFEKRRS